MVNTKYTTLVSLSSLAPEDLIASLSISNDLLLQDEIIIENFVTYSDLLIDPTKIYSFI